MWVNLNNTKIADKLFYGIIGLSVLVLGGLGSFIIHQRLNDFAGHLERRVETTANYLEDMLPQAASRLNAKKMRQSIENAASPELQAVEIFDRDGDLVYVYERGGGRTTYDKKTIRDLIYNNKPAGKMAAYFSVGGAINNFRVREFLRLIMLISGAGIVFGTGLYYLVRRFIIRPILKTLTFSEDIAKGRYDKRMAVTTGDEMGLLQNSLNKMTDALQESVENLKASFYEAETAHKQALEASRLKSEFLANMSHEIRTPINAINGFADLLLENEKDEERREGLATIKKSAGILLESISEILDFSKIEAGKVKISKSDFLLRDLIEEILPIIKIRLHGKEVEFKEYIDRGLDMPLIGDRMRLRQILLNVLINSAKFTHKGYIFLSVTPDRNDSKMLFKVEDTGIGIPKNMHEQIFEPFIQADGGITREYGGTGLGLAIAKRLVELLGGRIWLEDRLGGGTILYFTADYI